MRGRIVRVAVAAVTVALILFGVPLAVVARTMIITDERGELERAALAASGQVGPDFTTGDQVELPRTESDKQVAIYDVALRLRLGEGPTTADAVTRQAAGGLQADGQVNGELVVAVPVMSAEAVVAVVRAATSARLVWQWILLTWVVLATLAAAALVGAVLVARRQARLLSQPLEALSGAAVRVAEGDLNVRTQPSGGPEIERVARTQNAMLDRLRDVLDRERQFSADASHQLRTPLTGLQLGLETALEQAARDPKADLRPALLEAIDRAGELDRTVADILRLSRPGPDRAPATAPRPLPEVMADVEDRWHGPLANHGRRLTVHADPECLDASLPGFVLTEVLAILLDNTLQHGQGHVSVSVRDLADALAIDVTDEGRITADADTLFHRGTSGGSGSGIGLALARTMAESIGGRLLLTSRSPTRFSLLLPRHTPVQGRS